MADVYKERFDWPPREYVNLNETTDVSRGFVFVTGSSANHFKYVIKYFVLVCFVTVVDLGGAGNEHSNVHLFLFSCSFQQKLGQIIGWLLLRDWCTPLGNPGSTTAVMRYYLSTWLFRSHVFHMKTVLEIIIKSVPILSINLQ